MSKTLELYVHIPFCVKKCNYCDLKEKGKRLDEIEEEKRRSSQLRK